MHRKKFIQQTGVIALGVGIFGKVSWSKEKFIGDTPTTTDILGPFYRPGAPLRANINPSQYAGQKFHLTGTVLREDGKTPFKNALVEIWQCDENKVYDNISDEFRYRGSQRTGADGKYHFIAMHPIPYPAGENADIWRPAHIHLLISGEGQQDLVTQIYLLGEPYIDTDGASASPDATKRRLKITRNSSNEETVRFDVVMAKEFRPDNSVFEKLAGVYIMNDKTTMEFSRKGDFLLLRWNSQIREALSYKGYNTFAGGLDNKTTAKFELQKGNEVKVTVHFKTLIRGEFDIEGIKTFKYNS